MTGQGRVQQLLCLAILSLLIVPGQASAQLIFPLEVRQNVTQYNFQSESGVPISSTKNDPKGSDGRAPLGSEQIDKGLTGSPPTGGQFQGILSWGTVANPRSPASLNEKDKNGLAGNAFEIGLPNSEELGMVLLRAQGGAPFLNRSVSFLFGGIIPPPSEDENGDEFDESVMPGEYWVKEPHLTEGVESHEINGYYYSIHAKSVFAIKPGPVKIVWRKSTPYDDPRLTIVGNDEIAAGDGVRISVKGTPEAYDIGDRIDFSGGGKLTLTAAASTGSTTLTGNLTKKLASGETGVPSRFLNTELWAEYSGYYYSIYNKRYNVSGSAAKETRKIFWNTAGYKGPQVIIPDTRIGELNIVYNEIVPERVPTNEGIPANQSGAESSGSGISLPLPDGNGGVALVDTVTDTGETVFTRTLWHERNSLLALNREGRVFVELLGDFKEDGRSRVHLGYEIVDIYKHSNPDDITIELGDPVTAWAPEEAKDDTHLTPTELLSIGGTEFVYRGGGEKPRYYATRETKNLNDYQLHWMNEGLEGILWPYQHSRYKFIWPDNPERYSHYIRPLVTSTSEQMKTGVLMPVENAPFIQYEDPTNKKRTFFTDDVRLYTVLDQDYPAHRSLLRFSSGQDVYFERVFSWLDKNIKDSNLSLSARGLKEWLPSWDLNIWRNSDSSVYDSSYDLSATDSNGDPDPVNQLKIGFLESTELNHPRNINQTVNVGDRIDAPEGELGSAEDVYWAGYIRRGDAYNDGAYMNPYEVGFEKANLGAIIPVNAAEDNNIIEVQWFRKNSSDPTKGFKSIYWPAAIGKYTIQWPTSSKEIVLASNDGSGALSSLEAKGTIYHENVQGEIGYNPNEEHALMQAGQAYALRDDLNITNKEGYSSHPFVLVEYTEADGRPAMTTFKVMREKPENQILFDYITEAGQILQAPMPLPLLAKPVVGAGDSRINYNQEPPATGGDEPEGWGGASESQKASYIHYPNFTYKDRKDNHWVYRGLHDGPPELKVGTYNKGQEKFISARDATARVGEQFSYTLHASQRAPMLKCELSRSIHTIDLSVKTSTTLPAWLTIEGLTISGTPTSPDEGVLALELVITPKDGGESVSQTLSITVTGDTDRVVVGQGTKNIIHTISGVERPLKVFGGGEQDRTPALSEAPTSVNSFTMQFYYRTLEGFAWPGYDAPEVDSIVPYLLPRGDDGTPLGDPTDASTESLKIVYRPVWPADTPQLDLSETLTGAKKGLPAVRGQTSMRVLYQQSIAGNIVQGEAASSVILFDPTREKTFPLGAEGALQSVPSSVYTSNYQGKTYFPNLPPHLSQRLLFDPNRGEKGALVFRGEFVDEIVGEKYLLLNVLRGNDLQAAKGLCPDADAENKGNWDAAIAALSTGIETFYEDPDSPGKWQPNTSSSPVMGNSGDEAIGMSTIGIGGIAKITHDDTAVDSYALSASGPGIGYVTLISNDGNDPTKAGLPISIHVIRVGQPIYQGEVKVLYSSNPLDELVTFQHTADLGGKFDEFNYEWKIQPPVDGTPPKVQYAPTDVGYDSDDPKKLAVGWTPLDGGSGTAKPRYTLGGSGIQTLGDNYIIMRYKPIVESHPGYDEWSDWTEPQLAEGWIKRVLAGINPFNQRVTDMFNNSVNIDGSMLTQAGRRWEGDIPLNLENINDHGLIEIYETVLNRGKMLSIDAGINYGPANDALLLAAGYLNDLYMFLGNEAYADASNPTIGIGTKDKTYGDIATSLFSFKGQMPSLLEEELGLLRGRDDFMQPGVETGPVYNRLFWNYTRGIDSGEVVYALNYNIQEDQGEDLDGVINAADASRMYPQGHGDAYGHYLSALKGYYKLLTDNDYTWAPRTEAVTVLGKAVQVDYMDERKFAAAASAVARTGKQVFELTWRQDYKQNKDAGWAHFSKTRTSDRRSHVVAGQKVYSKRQWGMDHWASRTGIGSMVNWALGNAMLPPEDTDPSHEGIQKIDRTTVPELQELSAVAVALQINLDNAEAGLNPLGMSDNTIAFDIDPDKVRSETHFEQVYERATQTLKNAVSAFDDAKNVTRMMRSEEDSINDFQSQVEKEELAFKHRLIELYGTPYSDDVGVGKTYKQGYDGPDLLHYSYVDKHEITAKSSDDSVATIMNPSEVATFRLDVQNLPTEWDGTGKSDLKLDGEWTGVVSAVNDSYDAEVGEHFIEYELDTHGFFSKPNDWTGRRESPGQIQEAISNIVKARNAAFMALGDQEVFKYTFDRHLELFESQSLTHDIVTGKAKEIADNNEETNGTILTKELGVLYTQLAKEAAEDIAGTAVKANAAETLIFGFSNGGSFGKAINAIFGSLMFATKAALNVAINEQSRSIGNTKNDNENDNVRIQLEQIGPAEWSQERKEAVLELENEFNDLRGNFNIINLRLQELGDARRVHFALVAEGNRIQKEREIFRQRASAVVQGFRTRDASFRIFRNEKLERYKTLYDLAAKYSYLTAKAYDYETGLLHTDQGKSFISRIVKSRSIGVVKDGRPQYAGGNAGDPGLSGVLAEMDADWSVVKGRLGFNNPDTYGTTVSMRSENYRILPGKDGIYNWRDQLESTWQPNVLLDEDVRRHCMQIDNGDGLPVPGLVLEFKTVITDGLNLFGKPLSGADSYLSTSSFANKINAVGIAFEGYKGMTNPNSNSAEVDGAGGDSPDSPGAGFLDPLGLSATPYVYLIPVGVDSMRSPPLGDTSVVRTWNVQDAAIPLPFNIGASGFSTKKLWQSADSLSEDLFTVRKHQAFRAVSSGDMFKNKHSVTIKDHTNRRLVGRSVWNSKWKLVIPGKALFNDPDEGINRFIETVEDIKIYFQTYSYSGN
jgi:hypothetical protein